MHHFEAHKLSDSWELRAGLLDADPTDASISACLRECAAALRNIATPAPAASAEPQPEPTTWSRYVAGMIACYLKWPDDDERVEAVAGIIERRRWAEPQPEREPLSYRLLTALDTIQADDEFLQEDCISWAIDANAVFAGARYQPGSCLRVARRKLAGIGTKGGDK